MKVTDLSSTHKKYIKKYGAKKAAEKYNLNLTSAKKYEKQYNKNSYKGKRTLGKKSKDSEVDIDFEDVEDADGVPTNSIGAALGYDAADSLPDPTGMSGPQMPGMGEMNSLGSALGGAMGAMPPMAGAMPPMAGAMPGMPAMGAMPGMFNGQSIDPSNVDPLMVQVSAPYNQQMTQQMPNLPMTSGAMIGGGEGKPARKIDLSKLAFF